MLGALTTLLLLTATAFAAITIFMTVKTSWTKIAGALAYRVPRLAPHGDIPARRSVRRRIVVHRPAVQPLQTALIATA